MKLKTEDNREITIPDDVVNPYLPKRTGYERASNGGDYQWVLSAGDCVFDTDTVSSDDTHYRTANYYTDERLARDNARADTLMRRLRRYAAEHGGIPSKEDWKAGCAEKWGIGFANNKGYLFPDAWATVRIPGAIYFTTKEACEDAIKEFYDDLIWYLTEYEGQVRA